MTLGNSMALITSSTDGRSKNSKRQLTLLLNQNPKWLNVTLLKLVEVSPCFYLQKTEQYTYIISKIYNTIAKLYDLFYLCKAYITRYKIVKK